MALDIGIWTKVPAVARFCDHAEKARGHGYVACLYLPTSELLWAVGVASLVWFLPNMIWWATDVYAFACRAHCSRRRVATDQ